MTDTEKTKPEATNETESDVNAETQEDLLEQADQPGSTPADKPKTARKSPSKTKKAPKEEDKTDEKSEAETGTAGPGEPEPQPQTTDSETPESELLLKFTIDIPKDNIDKEFDEALEKYAGEIKLPGFRKGKVPVEVIKSRYKEAIREEVINQVVEKAVFEKIEKDKIKIISRPEVLKIDHEDGKDLSADIQVEVFPAVELPYLETLEVKIPAAELKSDEFDEKKHIDYVLESHQRRVPVKREIKDGDYITLKHQAMILPGKRMTPRKDANFLVNEKETFEILDLYKEVLGKESDAKLVFRRTYPADYHKRAWADKEIEHQVSIENIFEAVKPELTEEFLKSIGFENEEAFKNKLKEEFDRVQQQRIEDKKLKYIIDTLCESVSFPLPRGMVEHETAHRLEHTQSRFPVDMSDETKVKEFVESIKVEAEKGIRWSFIVEAVKEKFNLEVSNDDLENQYKIIAEKNHLPLKDVRKYYSNKENTQDLKENLLRDKVISLIKGKVQFKEV